MSKYVFSELEILTPQIKVGDVILGNRTSSLYSYYTCFTYHDFDRRADLSNLNLIKPKPEPVSLEVYEQYQQQENTVYEQPSILSHFMRTYVPGEFRVVNISERKKRTCKNSELVFGIVAEQRDYQKDSGDVSFYYRELTLSGTDTFKTNVRETHSFKVLRNRTDEQYEDFHVWAVTEKLYPLPEEKQKRREVRIDYTKIL